jgi:hypothetical protein
MERLLTKRLEKIGNEVTGAIANAYEKSKPEAR